MRRREFLRAMGIGAWAGVSALLVACRRAEAPTPTAAEVPSPTVAVGQVPSPVATTPAVTEKLTLELWDQQQSDLNIQQAYIKALEDFQQENPDIVVKVTTTPYAQYRDKLLVAVQGGRGPDIMSLDEIWTPEFAAAGIIEPLDPYIQRSASVKPDAFFQPAWDTNLWQKQIWGIPLNFDVWEQLFYNADHFREAGLDPDKPPRTWDEWLEALPQLTAPPQRFGIGLLGHKGEDTVVMLNSLMYSNGGAIIDEDGNVVIYSQENIETLEFYLKLSKYAPEGVANVGEAEAVSMFAAGKVSMILDGQWQQDTMNARATFDWRIAVPPAPAGKKFVGALGGWNLAINKASKNKDVAFRLIEYLTTNKEVQKTINSLTPALRVAGEEFVKEKRRQPEVILETLTSGRPRPISPVYPQVSDIEQQMVQAILSGTPVEEALQKAQRDIEKVVKSAR